MKGAGRAFVLLENLNSTPRGQHEAAGLTAEADRVTDRFEYLPFSHIDSLFRRSSCRTGKEPVAYVAAGSIRLRNR